MFYKKNNKVHFAVTFVFILLVCACNGNQKRNSQLFQQVEQVLEEQPDSALILLQSIEKPEGLSREDYADYLLLQVQAHAKTGVNIKDDTLIYTSAAYFSQTDDYLKAAKANAYAARVLLAQGNNEKAMEYLLPAKDFATTAGDAKWLGFIHYSMGNAYSSNGNFNKASTSFRQAREYYTQAGKTENGIWMLDYIGHMDWQLGEPDSALHCFRQVLDYAEKTENEWYMSRAHRRMSSVYWDLKQLDKCKSHALLSISMDNKGDDAIFNYPALSQCYLQEGKLDSALYYTEKMRELKAFDMPESMLIYQNLIFQIEEKKGNLPVALVSAKEVIQLQASLAEANRKSTIPYIFEQHEKERMENSYNRVVIHRLRLAVGFISAILLGVLAGWYLMYRIKRKETELAEARQTLQVFQKMVAHQDNQLEYKDSQIATRDEQLHTYNLLLEEQSEQLEGVLTEHNRKDERLRAILMEKLNIAQKVAQLNIVPTDNDDVFMKRYQKVFGKNLMDELDWENLYALINDLYNGFADKIKAKYPDIAAKDLQLCCFIRAGFQPEEMAVLLNYTQNTIRVKKSRLAQKMGFADYDSFLSAIMDM